MRRILCREAKNALVRILLIPSFIAQVTLGCAGTGKEPPATYLAREIETPKSRTHPEIAFAITELKTTDVVTLDKASKRTPAGSVLLRFDLDEAGTVTSISAETVGEATDPAEAKQLRHAARDLVQNSLRITATFEGRPVAAKGVETLIRFDRVVATVPGKTAPEEPRDEDSYSAGRAALMAVGIVLLVPLVVLSSGSIHFGK